MLYDFIDFSSNQCNFIQKIKEKRATGLFLGMGSGKTVISLTAANDLLITKKVKNVLVIAPLRVANTVWKQEAADWDHLKHLSFAICTGSEIERLYNALSSADIHVINRENIPWLVSKMKWKWDMVIVDESTSFKNGSSRRFKSLRKHLKNISRIVCLTGTPSPNGYMDLWAQLFLLDNGERLGKNISMFRRLYFNSAGYMGYGYKLKRGAEGAIRKKISDICVSASFETKQGAKYINQYIELPKKVDKQYKELEKEFILLLKNGASIEAPSTANVGNKLLQICNGAVYDSEGKVQILHDEKIKALKDILEDNPNENFLVAYNYKHDLQRLKRAFPNAKEISKTGEEVLEWNRGNIKMLLVHPASSGQGLNLQFGGSIIIWFGLTWNLEFYQQLIARLLRQGQTRTVRIIHILTKGSKCEDVLLSLTKKDNLQKKLLDYLRI